MTATTAARSVAGFDHLVLTVANRNAATGTFDLTIQLADAANAVLVDSAGDPFEVALADLNVNTDYGALIAAAAVPATAPEVVVPVAVEGAPALLPPNGTTVSVDDGSTVVATLGASRIVLTAANPGVWGNRVQATVSYDDATGGAFHLRLVEVAPDGTRRGDEVFFNVATDAASAGFVERVLAERSVLARASSIVTLGALPATTVLTTTFSGGADGAAPRLTADVLGAAAARTGVQSLATADLFNLLCVPLDGWHTTTAGDVAFWSAVIAFAGEHQAVRAGRPT